MKENYNKIIKAWDEKSKLISAAGVELPAIEDISEYLAQFFCPGPFYSYVFDFSAYRFLYVRPTIKDILGVDTEGLTIEKLLSRLYSMEDIGHMERCEVFAGHFFFDFLAPEEIKDYKVTYFLRFRDAKNRARLILHQSMALTLDKNDRIHTVIGTHSDVSHLVSDNNGTISFQSLVGGKSYLGIQLNEIDLGKLGPTYPFPLKQSNNPLTNRETQVLRLIADGIPLDIIAQSLFIAFDTVRTHRDKARRKLECRSIAQAVGKAIRMGII